MPPVPIVDPRGRVAGRRSGLAPRARRVPARARIGFLVNEVSRQTGPDFWAYTEALEEQLRRHLAVEAVRVAKPVLSRPAGDELLAHLKDCSGVVSGLAK